MKDNNRTNSGFSLPQLIAATAACGLMVAFIPPSLEQLRVRMQPVTCANNLRVSHQGWNVYGSDYDGVWMAPWDRNRDRMWPGATYQQQYPYTMVHFVTGGGIPLGETVWMSGVGWYGPDGRHGYPPEYCSSPQDAPQLQCPTIVAGGPDLNPLWYSVTSYSYAIMGWGQEQPGMAFGYNAAGYPTPDLMTHPSTTLLLMDLSVMLGQDLPNAWSVYVSLPTDPHSGKSNYVFCDGHVEMLFYDQVNEQMWESLWTPDP
jgi:prepilin-type processing-associated H-X9-DG protein